MTRGAIGNEMKKKYINIYYIIILFSTPPSVCTCVDVYVKYIRKEKNFQSGNIQNTRIFFQDTRTDSCLKNRPRKYART